MSVWQGDGGVVVVQWCVSVVNGAVVRLMVRRSAALRVMWCVGAVSDAVVVR